MDWSTAANVILFLQKDQQYIGYIEEPIKPKELKKALGPGMYHVIVLSSNIPSAYTLEISVPSNVSPTPTWNNSVAIQEVEPNDVDPQVINLLPVGQSLTIRGRVNSGGVTNSQLNGEFDFYGFTLTESTTVEITLQWSAQAKLVLSLGNNEGIIEQKANAPSPMTLRKTLPPGSYLFLAASMDNSSDYTCTITKTF